jgi:hypothetical protein
MSAAAVPVTAVYDGDAAYGSVVNRAVCPSATYSRPPAANTFKFVLADDKLSAVSGSSDNLPRVQTSTPLDERNRALSDEGRS